MTLSPPEPIDFAESTTEEIGEDPAAILADIRKRIIEHAGNDPDRWFYANRFVFARLMLDERKTKVRVKKYLLDNNSPCYRCGKPFDSRSGIHLHRLDGEKGYSRPNCVLMHPECHRALHSEGESERPAHAASDFDRLPSGTVSKESKCYENQYWIYWWDISPGLRDRLSTLGAIEFIKKDTREKCLVEAKVLHEVLTAQNQTSRGQGNWGIRVLASRPNDLAIESPANAEKWPIIPATWLCDDED